MLFQVKLKVCRVLMISAYVLVVSQLNSSVSRSAKGDFNLLCQVRSQIIRFCSFIRPDGEILHMTPAVGNSK